MYWFHRSCHSESSAFRSKSSSIQCPCLERAIKPWRELHRQDLFCCLWDVRDVPDVLIRPWDRNFVVVFNKWTTTKTLVWRGMRGFKIKIKHRLTVICFNFSSSSFPLEASHTSTTCWIWDFVLCNALTIQCAWCSFCRGQLCKFPASCN